MKTVCLGALNVSSYSVFKKHKAKEMEKCQRYFNSCHFHIPLFKEKGVKVSVQSNLNFYPIPNYCLLKSLQTGFSSAYLINGRLSMAKKFAPQVNKCVVM